MLRAGPGLDILFAGRAGPRPHNSVCGPGPGRVCTTAAGPGRAWASNHTCEPGLGLNFRPVRGPSSPTSASLCLHGQSQCECGSANASRVTVGQTLLGGIQLPLTVQTCELPHIILRRIRRPFCAHGARILGHQCLSTP